MIEKKIKLDKGTITGYYLDLGKAPLIILQAPKGYIMCGYLNMNTANKLGDIAGRVTGVKTFEDTLQATVIEISDQAKKEGLTEGITASEFLKKLL